MQHVCGCFSQSGGVIDMSKKDSSPARDRSGAGNVSKRILGKHELINRYSRKLCFTALEVFFPIINVPVIEFELIGLLRVALQGCKR